MSGDFEELPLTIHRTPVSDPFAPLCGIDQLEGAASAIRGLRPRTLAFEVNTTDEDILIR